MNERHRQYLAHMGIPVYALRSRSSDNAGESVPAASVSAVVPVAEKKFAKEPALSNPDGQGKKVGASLGPVAASAEVWRALEAEVAGCTRCALHRGRTHTVFGVGRRDADLLIVGEAPGAEEDRQGEPFVGRAGQLLNAMLKAIGFARDEVYIANILKCRPPSNRDPRPEEAEVCTPYLARQIALIRPYAMLALGRIAAQWLLQTDTPIGRLRGREHRFGEQGTPLIVTYHPAYLLRSPLAKAKTWQDLCMVKQVVSARSSN
ncbi:MAG TPA: uracil-DNA glycosylase [Gammaproteobacteria bacterium]|nr:uracil-DNA glycosylase [Gammaproteobacteria bacterium]